MPIDLKLFYFFNNLAGRNETFDNVIIFLADYLQYFVITTFLLLLFFSAYTQREKIQIFWITTISIIIARLGVTELIRFFYNRPRPFMVYLDVKHLVSDNAWSFPSGHAAFFFAMAMAIYLYNKKWGIWFFLASFLIVLSRVIAGVHYPSDILGGVLIGILTAYLVKKYAIIKL